MATITVQPEHLEGFRALVAMEFESACEGQEVDRLRELIAVGDELGCWDHASHKPTWNIGSEMSDELRDRLIGLAGQVAQERLGDFHFDRARGQIPNERLEREAHAMLAISDSDGRVTA